MVKSLRKREIEEPEHRKGALVHDFWGGRPDDYIDGTDARAVFSPRAMDEED
jgi:hypothetical protein